MPSTLTIFELAARLRPCFTFGSKTEICLSKAVRLITRRLLKALERHIFVLGGQPVQITASIGATFFPSPTMTAEELLAQADIAI